MCRNIKLLHHFEPPTTEAEIHDAALQFVRKVTGMRAPSRANQEPFATAVDEVSAVVTRLFAALESYGPPHTREVEKRKAVERGRKREARQHDTVRGSAVLPVPEDDVSV